MKQTSLDNKRMVVAATDEEGHPRLEQAVHGKPNRFTPKVAAVKHFVIVEKEGFNPRLTCWCGSDLELDYAGGQYEAMTAKLNGFLDVHEGCEVKHETV